MIRYFWIRWRRSSSIRCISKKWRSPKIPKSKHFRLNKMSWVIGKRQSIVVTRHRVCLQKEEHTILVLTFCHSRIFVHWTKQRNWQLKHHGDKGQNEILITSNWECRRSWNNMYEPQMAICARLKRIWPKNANCRITASVPYFAFFPTSHRSYHTGLATSSET